MYITRTNFSCQVHSMCYSVKYSFNPSLMPKGGFQSPPYVFFRITFVCSGIFFALFDIPRPYIDAHFGENRLQISVRVLGIYFFSQRGQFQENRRCFIPSLQTYSIIRISASMTHRNKIPKTTPTLSGSGNSMTQSAILFDVTGSRKFKMAAV